MATTPKNKLHYTFKNNQYECNHIRPTISPIEQEYTNVYSRCINARDMNGGLDYSVVIALAKAKEIYDLEELLFYVDEVEYLRNKNKK